MANSRITPARFIRQAKARIRAARNEGLLRLKEDGNPDARRPKNLQIDNQTYTRLLEQFAGGSTHETLLQRWIVRAARVKDRRYKNGTTTTHYKFDNQQVEERIRIPFDRKLWLPYYFELLAQDSPPSSPLLSESQTTRWDAKIIQSKLVGLWTEYYFKCLKFFAKRQGAEEPALSPQLHRLVTESLNAKGYLAYWDAKALAEGKLRYLNRRQKEEDNTLETEIKTSTESNFKPTETLAYAPSHVSFFSKIGPPIPPSKPAAEDLGRDFESSLALAFPNNSPPSLETPILFKTLPNPQNQLSLDYQKIQDTINEKVNYHLSRFSHGELTGDQFQRLLESSLGPPTEVKEQPVRAIRPKR